MGFVHQNPAAPELLHSASPAVVRNRLTIAAWMVYASRGALGAPTQPVAEPAAAHLRGVTGDSKMPRGTVLGNCRLSKLWHQFLWVVAPPGR